jgi:hypothetical protein
MTVTPAQAQILATLARDCRPNGARRWDSAGIMAWIKQRHEWSLSVVALELLTAAANADCETPGGIEHFGKSQPASNRLATVDPANRCGICSEARERCARIWAGDHVFEAPGPKPSTDVPRVVAELKTSLAPIAPRTEPSGLDALESRRPELAATRVRLAALNPGLAVEREPMEEGA